MYLLTVTQLVARRARRADTRRRANAGGKIPKFRCCFKDEAGKVWEVKHRNGIPEVRDGNDVHMVGPINVCGITHRGVPTAWYDKVHH